jgi:hypothetical protein
VPLRLLAVVTEFVLAGSMIGWGLATTLRPGRWSTRGARWWVGWTREPVARAHGIAVVLVGAGLLVGAVAAASTAPAVAVPELVRELQLSGLAVVLLGGALLAVTHPAPEEFPAVPASAAVVVPVADVAVAAEVPPPLAAAT